MLKNDNSVSIQDKNYDIIMDNNDNSYILKKGRHYYIAKKTLSGFSNNYDEYWWICSEFFSTKIEAMKFFIEELSD